MMRDRGSVLCLVLIAVFAGSIFWINFHSAFWYDMDMALNAHVAKLMWNEKTFFPENWIFGNQYFIIETPNLAALFYGLTHQTTLSAALACSLWVFIIAGTFIWCLKPFAPAKGLLVGTLCLVGGIIFGTSAASYTKGLQVLYTMASYYASYLEVLLLSLGAWLRLYSGRKLHWTLWGLVLLLNFAVGMHSLREMLILGIPLLALSVLLFLRNKEKSGGTRCATLLAILILVAESAGYLLIKNFDIPTSPNVEGLHTEWSLGSLFVNSVNASKNLLRISGIAFIKDGTRYLPLFFCALGVAVCVIRVLINIVRKKDLSTLSVFILFAGASVLAVFAVGVFFFQTRDIYFFIYWLLATLSIVYLITRYKGKREKWLTGLVCLIATVNYGYNFIPDFIDHHRYAPQMAETTQWLIDEGYTTFYGDDCAVFAAASKDRITAAPIRLNIDKDGLGPLSIFLCNKDISLYNEQHSSHAVVCLSNYYLDRSDEIPEKAVHILSEKMNLLIKHQWGKRSIMLFAAKTGEEIFFF